MKTSPAGIAFIKKAEGLRLKAYQDVAGVWTIGYGSTGAVREGDEINEVVATELLSTDLRMAEVAVSHAVRQPMEQYEFDALVSFTFNLGAGALRRSTLLTLLNKGDKLGAAAEFARWHRAGGGRVTGLLIRRLREALMFLGETA